MKLEEVMKLIDAGYTKEDISKFMQPETAAAPDQAKPETAAAPAAKTEAPAADPVLTELQELRKAVKAMTIVTGAAEKPAEKTVDDILKKLI